MYFCRRMWLAAVLEWCLAHLSYWVVFVLMVMENSVFPLPAELIVAPAAYNAANGEANFWLLLLLTTAGSTAGAIINYYLSLWIGAPMIHRFAESRCGRLVGLSSKRLSHAEELFRRRGNVAIFLGRILPVGRQFISIPAGLARMNVLSFIGFTTLGSALWNLFLMGIGYYLAALLPPDQIAARLVEYSNWVTFGFIGAIAAAVVWHYAKRYVERRRRR